jgi:hypothetical protein
LDVDAIATFCDHLAVAWSHQREAAMGRHLFAVLLVAPVLASIAAPLCRGQVIAQTGFNDQTGINSNPTPNSPYTIGQTAGGRGVGEAGWGDTWTILTGGAFGGDPDAIVRATSAFEGDGGLSMVTGLAGSTVARRKLGEGQTRRFIFESRVNFGSVGELHGIPLEDSYPFAADRNGPMWRIAGPVGNRFFEVFDGQSNQLGTWENTGIRQRPGEWQNVAMDVNVPTQQFTFSVDGVRYVAPDPLGFHNAATQINAIAFFTTGSPWIDSVLFRLPQRLAGDANRDGTVNATDFALLAGNFGAQSGADWSRGDFNADGAVNGSDFALLAGNFGKSGGDPPVFGSGGAAFLSASESSAVPEPSTLWLLALPAVLLGRRGKVRLPRDGGSQPEKGLVRRRVVRVGPAVPAASC